MECKNCGANLRTDYSYCPNCGAKVIRNRLTIKNLTYDVFERYFNLDNTLIKTIWHMIISPEKVCDGYISGLRKKYLNPISLLAINLTLSGFIYFIMKKYAWDKINFGNITSVNSNAGNEATEKIMASTMEYSSFVYLLFIPILAIGSFLFFNKKNYNFPEHVVISIYALSAFSIVSSIYSITVLFTNPVFYFDFSIYFMVAMIGFCVYVFIRNSRYSLVSNIWRILMFSIIFFMGYIGITVLLFGIMFITGEISLQDFVPQK